MVIHFWMLLNHSILDMMKGLMSLCSSITKLRSTMIILTTHI